MIFVSVDECFAFLVRVRFCRSTLSTDSFRFSLLFFVFSMDVREKPLFKTKKRSTGILKLEKKIPNGPLLVFFSHNHGSLLRELHADRALSRSSHSPECTH